MTRFSANKKRFRKENGLNKMSVDPYGYHQRSQQTNRVIDTVFLDYRSIRRNEQRSFGTIGVPEHGIAPHPKIN